VLADFLWRMGDVELDGSATTRPEIDKQRSHMRVEQVVRMRLAMQQLLVSAAFGNGGRQNLQRFVEKLPICVPKLWCTGGVVEQRSGLRNSISEMRGPHLDLPHAGVQAQERLRILWRSDSGLQ
jgi:hypothetical protein